MKDDNQENPQRMRYFRYAVFSLAGLLVLSLGLAFLPSEPPAPAELPFSEQARAAALEEALRLRSTGLELAASGADGSAEAPAARALDQVVTLLTIQARVLLLPGDEAPAGAGTTAAAPASVLPSTAAPSPSPPAALPATVTVAEFADRLAGSGRQRLQDAGTADGGMARLLAGAGTAQLLAAERLGAPGTPKDGAAASPGASALTTPGATTRETPSSCPATTSAAIQAPATPPGGAAELGAALVAAADAELEAVYGYQAALPRLPAVTVGPASGFLAQHRDLAAQAKELGLLHCGNFPPQAPGYVLDQGFLDAPAAGLAGLEADTLPLYGDIVALSGGATRNWALAALQEAARRAQQWGATVEPLPGLVVDQGKLPELAQ
ncbi:DUF4439 domain-containing protein [Arthrobacter sp. 9AX]|uniref:DUF4439 domain-containing protein n=1 Tax=Arthrobacter sp. 9AX TaxID=2653131 RepID=UPI001F3E5F9D|nr:DUF4439 domain-containing protein [Arthrobacter sp. 9AX]